MKKYEVTGPHVNIHEGIVSLSSDQAEKRGSALKSIGFGRYEIKEPICLKRGEQFGFSGQVNKNITEFVSKVKKKK